MCCPCGVCKNTKDYSSSKTLHTHLFRYGFMSGYNCWTKHGERGVVMKYNEEEEDDDNYPMFPEYGATTMGKAEEEASYEAADDLGRAIVDAQRNCESEKERLKLERMLEDHKKLLYPNCEDGKKKLGTTLELLQWKAENGVSDKGFEKLLKMIKNMLPLEAYSLSFSATFQIPCQIHHSLPSIAAIPVWYPAFSCHLRNLGTTIFCDPLTCAPTSTSPFHSRSFSVHQQWPDQDHQRAHLMPLLQLPPL